MNDGSEVKCIDGKSHLFADCICGDEFCRSEYCVLCEYMRMKETNS